MFISWLELLFRFKCIKERVLLYTGEQAVNPSFNCALNYEDNSALLSKCCREGTKNLKRLQRKAGEEEGLSQQ